MPCLEPSPRLQAGVYWQLRFYRRKCLTLSVLSALQTSVATIPQFIPFALKQFSQMCAWMHLAGLRTVATARCCGSRPMLAAIQCNATNCTGFYSPVRSPAVASDQLEAKLFACATQSPSYRNVGSRRRGVNVARMMDKAHMMDCIKTKTERGGGGYVSAGTDHPTIGDCNIIIAVHLKRAPSLGLAGLLVTGRWRRRSTGRAAAATT